MEMKTEMEMGELEDEVLLEKSWNTVLNKKKNKKKNQLMMCRPWAALPSLALFNIIRNLNFKDRFGSFPLVCKAWNSVISNDPRCCSSMIPESISPDDAFIDKPVYSLQVDLIPSKLLYRRDRPVPIGGKSDDPSICPGVSYLRTFIKKSSSCSSVVGGRSSSSITSLCLDHFSFSYPNNVSVDHDEILHLIAHCCPNLKHISFHGFYCASKEAVLEVFHRCKKIELIDFSDSGYADSVQFIEELVNCLPNLRGIRMEEYYRSIHMHDFIATNFPWIKLHYEELESNYCYHCGECYYQPPLDLVRAHRPRLHPFYRRLCYYCESREEEEEEAEKRYYGEDEEEYWKKYSILKEKERRRHHHYVSVNVVLRSRMRKSRNKKQQLLTEKKKKQQLEASFILKMKMRKKRDIYDCQDFYVRAAAAF